MATENNNKVKINRTGFITDEDIYIAKPGDKITINYKYLDESGKEKKFKTEKMYAIDNGGVITLDGNVVTVNKAGNANVVFELLNDGDLDEEGVYYGITIYSDFQKYIDDKIKNINTIDVVSDHHDQGSDPNDLVEPTLFDLLFDNYPSFDRYPELTCVDNKNCEGKDGIFDVNITYKTRNREFTAVKENLKVNYKGLKITACGANFAPHTAYKPNINYKNFLNLFS